MNLSVVFVVTVEVVPSVTKLLILLLYIMTYIVLGESRWNEM